MDNYCWGITFVAVSTIAYVFVKGVFLFGVGFTLGRYSNRKKNKNTGMTDKELHNKVLVSKYELLREGEKFSLFYHKEWHHEMMKMTKKTRANIIDVCSGTCLLYEVLNLKFQHYTYHGIDNSIEMLKIGKEKYQNNINFSTELVDVNNLYVPPKYYKYDLAVFRGALHHLKDIDAALNNTRHLLHDDGEAIISEPSSNKFIKKFRQILYDSKAENFSEEHMSYTVDELEKAITRNGFKVVKKKKFGLTAYIFGFPDMFTIYKVFPFWFKKGLYNIDKILLKIPVINSFAFTTIFLIKKTWK